MSQQLPVTADAFVESVFEFNRIGNPHPHAPGMSFDPAKVGFYKGMECEELAESLAALAEACVEPRLKTELEIMAGNLDQLGNGLKDGRYYGAVLRADREKLLDGSIDLAVVAIGCTMFQTPRFREAIDAVLYANMAKFPNGVPTRNAQGKVMKPEGWTPPNLLPYIDHYGE